MTNKGEIIAKFKRSENDTGSVHRKTIIQEEVFFKWLVRERVSCNILKTETSRLTDNLLKN